jgi:Uncharacterized conserved protein
MIATAFLLAVLPTAALAGPSCTTEAEAKWMSEEAMKAKIAEAGYKAKTFEVTGDCYELYGWSKEGKRGEIHFNPVNGDVVKADEH